jgi:hypothetical protein
MGTSSALALGNAGARDFPALFELCRRNGFLYDGVGEEAFHRLFRWLYLDCPAATGYELAATAADGQVVAHYGLTPLRFSGRGDPLVAALASNLVIDEAHRNGMLFFQLQGRVLREYASAGIDFVYGLVTRPLVLEAHLRTGYRRIGTVPVLARPYRLRSVAEAALAGSRLRHTTPLLALAQPLARLSWRSRPRDLEVVSIREFDAATSRALEGALGSRAERWAARDTETLNWRFFGAHGRDYRVFLVRDARAVLGYVALRTMPMKGLTALAVVDVVCQAGRGDALNALMHEVHRQALGGDVDLACVALGSGSDYAAAFRRSGFLRTGDSFTLIANTPRGRPPAVTPESFERWHVSWYDHDVV